MYVIGTAGHVDHGKSTLVEALTGIDPDRLREEKERGLTIDLGFAWLTLPSGQEVSIVDVPGHERFISNMLAGVGGIDLALLVVAADESVMPQTREHLAILDLLRVEHGLVAVTKQDLVDDDWLDLVKVDVEEVLEGTVLEGSPIVPVSGVAKEGLGELLEAIDGLLDKTAPRKDLGRPRLPIDRSFTIAGFGTVVTGTLIDGPLAVGQEVELALSGQRSRIRGLQTHRKRLEEAAPGRRVAVNLSGVAHDEIDRGEVLASPGWLRPTTAIDVHLRVLPDAPRAVWHNMYATVHTGSSETVARVRLLESRQTDPGESTWAQLKLEQPVTAVKGDYFVLRAGGATLGGGNIVDTHARRHRRNYAPILDRLTVMEKGSSREVLLKTIDGMEPAEFEALIRRANLQPQEARSELQAMADERLVVALGHKGIGPGSYLYTGSGWSSLTSRAQRILAGYHERHPLRKGAPKEEIRSRLALSVQVFNSALPLMREGGAVVEEGPLVRHPEHQPRLTQAQQREADEFLAKLDSHPYAPPTDSLPDEDILNLLAEAGKLVRVNDSVAFSTAAYEEMVERIISYIGEHGEITVADVRDMFGTSRKYALALMDHLDQQRKTRRVGDARVLR